MYVQLLVTVNVKTLRMVNSPLLNWIDYYLQFELHLTILTNLSNELTDHSRKTRLSHASDE